MPEYKEDEDEVTLLETAWCRSSGDGEERMAFGKNRASSGQRVCSSG